ncbi:MAG TPA: hypothetical protein VLD18_01095 [Verrucomicrobiae bacterium]|nr:hypothetical protein [Verrucomicrobiae bacterium]
MSRVVLILAGLLLWVTPASGQIAFQSATTSAEAASATGITFSHTVSSGSNLALVVGLTYRDNAGAAPSTVTATYNGVSMTLLGHTGRVNQVGAAIWCLANPATGPNDVVITIDQTVDLLRGGAIGFTGVDQTTPCEAGNTATGASLTPTITITTVTDNSWVVDSLYSKSGNATVTGSGQVERWNGTVNAGADDTGGSTFGPKTPAGAHSMDWSNNGESTNWALAGAAVKPATTAGAARRRVYVTRTMPGALPTRTKGEGK